MASFGSAKTTESNARPSKSKCQSLQCGTLWLRHSLQLLGSEKSKETHQQRQSLHVSLFHNPSCVYISHECHECQLKPIETNFKRSWLVVVGHRLSWCAVPPSMPRPVMLPFHHSRCWRMLAASLDLNPRQGHENWTKHQEDWSKMHFVGFSFGRFLKGHTAPSKDC